MFAKEPKGTSLCFLFMYDVHMTGMKPRHRKDPDSIFLSPKFLKLYAKRPKFKTLRPIPETIVARINPEICIIFVRLWRENLSPDARSGPQSRLQLNTIITSRKKSFRLFPKL